MTSFSCLSQCDNKKNGCHEARFLSYKQLKLKLRVFLTSCIVAMVTHYAIKSTIIFSLMAEHVTAPEL